MKPIIDYLIVIPLDEEFRYIRDVIEPVLIGKSLQAKTIGSHFYALTQLPTAAEASASVVLLGVGRMTESPVQSAVEAAVKEWRPATVLLVGIAGSLEPEKVKLGDVYVPSKVFGYTEAKAEMVGGKQKIVYRPTGHTLDCELFVQARAVHFNFFTAWRRAALKDGRADPALRPKLRTGDGPNVHVTDADCLASGNTVVASKAFARDIQDAIGGKTVKAVEMEAKGLCEALTKIKPAPGALVVRGISDFADEDKARLQRRTKNAWRRWAAQNAARFALLFIEQRPAIAEDYRPVRLPSYPMQPHEKSLAMAMQAGIHAREGVYFLAFSPLLVAEHGIAATELTFEAVKSDGSLSIFTDFLLRHSDDHRVIKRIQGQGKITHRLERMAEPPPLELLVGFPTDITSINLTAKDEFSRITFAKWPLGDSPPMKLPPDNNPYPINSTSYLVPTELNDLTNLARLLAARAESSSNISGWDHKHRIEYLIDGLYGNERSWVAAGMPAWVEINLGADYLISMVAFGSERFRFHCDRAAQDFRISISRSETREERIVVFESQPSDSPVRDRREFSFCPQLARFVMIEIMNTADGDAARIDEIEVYGVYAAQRP